MKKRRLLPLTLPALAVVVAAPAFAAVSYSYSPAGLSFTAFGDASSDNITLSCVAGEVSPAAPTAAPCATLESLTVRPEDGSDSVDLSGLAAADFPELVDVMISDEDDFETDSMTGSELDEVFEVGLDDEVDAGDGDDVINGGDRVDAGPGDDVLFEVNGSIGADGGPGDDRFVQTLGIGGNDGGPGYDVMEIDYDRTGILFDGIEVRVTAGQILLTLGEEAVDTFIVGFEELRFTMPRGNDQSFDASAFPGRVLWAGSRGRDTVVGSESRDQLEARSGDDTVDARDGGFDIVDCGAGVDTAVVDPEDLVIDCETVSYPRPSTSAIKGPRTIAKGARASYTFNSSIDGSVFQCRIDRGAWKRCTSPTTVTAKKKLSKGRHTLFVRAGFPAGNWDATPSKKRFRITRR